jgi:anti-anti-sigma regulatory factor
MKIALSTVDGVSILTGGGEITTHDVDVLRAGLTKLLKSGRNRIILEFPEAERIPDSVLREMAKLDILARELSGRIVMLGANEQFRKRVLQFALPPVMECFDKREQALGYFKQKDAPKVAIAPTAVPSAGQADVPPTQKAKAEFRSKELSGATELRKRVSELENENQLLTKQLHAAWLASRPAPTPQASQGEFEILKKRFEEILEQTKASQPKQ